MSDSPPTNESGLRRSIPGAPPQQALLAGDPGPEDPDKNPQQALYAMLAKVWERSQKTVAGHVEVLERARDLAIHSQLDEPSRLRAVDSAHKLAGVLGTFGLPRGTELARVAEEVFGRPTSLSLGELERVGVALDELSSLVKTPDPLRRPASLP